ncbi:MAG TPA: NAD-binding protein [Acidobacteriota bacterium]|nr:NAD-binding protein [Acidobacteriota bacterium]
MSQNEIQSPWEEPESLKKFKDSLMLVAVVLLAGTVGFWIVGEGRSLFESFYLTVMIVTTVGLKEQYSEFNDAETTWSLLVMLVGIITALYATGNLVAFLIDGELKRVLGRRQLENKVAKLEDHFVVCGFGRMGRALCSALHEKGIPFVVIDFDPERTAMAEARHYLYLLGDATLEKTLEQARIETARGLASCLKGDPDNVLVTLSARGLKEDLLITARAEMEETGPKMFRAGANRVICPPVLGAKRILQMMLHPAVEELVDVAVSGAELEISKIAAGELPRAVDRTLAELQLPAKTGLMVIMVVHPDGKRKFNPSPQFTIKEGDDLIVVGPPSGLDILITEFGSLEKEAAAGASG